MILVVDDDVAVRALIATVLRKEGYRVLDASNGEHALEILKAHAGPGTPVAYGFRHAGNERNRIGYGRTERTPRDHRSGNIRIYVKPNRRRRGEIGFPAKTDGSA